jgi:hypothetical protein
MNMGYTPKARAFADAIHIVWGTRRWHRELQDRFKLHPAVIAAFNMHDPEDWQQLLLEWPHVATTDVTRLAYTRDERAGEDDRQTLTSLGKYLKQHWPHMADHHIRDFVAKYATAATFRIEYTTENIVNAVQKGPASCMKFDEDNCSERDELEALGAHPYEVYAPQYGWHVATRRMGHHIVGRALLMQRDNDESNPKYFVRTYRHKDGEHYSQPDDELAQWLHSQGYSHSTSWNRERLAYISRADTSDGDSDFIAPYIDGAAQHVDIDSERRADGTYKKFLRICSSGEFECCNQNGIATEQDTCRCSDCGERISEDEQRGIGIYGDEMVGDCCIDDYTNVVGRRGHDYYVPNDQAVEVDGTYYDRDYLGDNNIVELKNGDYCELDDAICVDDEWYHCDDDEIVCDHAGDYQLREDCVELHHGEWALEDEAWECAGSGNYYLHTDDEPVQIDGENYHEDYVPEPEEDETDEQVVPCPVRDVCLTIDPTTVTIKETV